MALQLSLSMMQQLLALAEAEQHGDVTSA